MVAVGGTARDEEELDRLKVAPTNPYTGKGTEIVHDAEVPP